MTQKAYDRILDSKEKRVRKLRRRLAYNLNSKERKATNRVIQRELFIIQNIAWSDGYDRALLKALKAAHCFDDKAPSWDNRR
jgi:hypothetical protein